MRYINWLRQFRPQSANNVGWLFFQTGLFFLASSAFLGGSFLFIALCFGSLKRAESYWRDIWNYPFILSTFLMLLGCLKAYSGWLAWAGLANWLPFFWAFWAFQPYLTTPESRRRTAICLLLGTVPVVITGFGQLWLGWEGPWQIFNGLIVWFIASDGNPSGRLSGLFDYANIAGAWLAIIWPFGLATLIQPFLNSYQKILRFLFVISIISALVLTDSRNAWAGLILAIPFVLGAKTWFWLVPCLLLICTLLGLAVLPGIDLEVQNLARKIVPENIWLRLNDMKYLGKRYLASTRLFQWHEAIKLIAERPFFGWGAAAFSILFPLLTGHGIWLGHAHNFPLEISVSHGVPVAILLVGVVISLLINALQHGLLTLPDNRNYCYGTAVFDRAWWAASLVLVLLHAVDMPLFDGRLNMAGWILLSGLRCLLASLKLHHSRENDNSLSKSNFIL